MQIKDIKDLERKIFAAKHHPRGIIYHDSTVQNVRVVVIVFPEDPSEEYYISVQSNTNMYIVPKSALCKNDRRKIAVWDTEVRERKKLLHLNGVKL